MTRPTRSRIIYSALLALALALPATAQIRGSQLPTAFPSSGDTVIAIQNGTTVQEGLGNISSFVGTNNVSSFDGRTGAINLLTNDISTALGYTPLSPTGNGSSLTGLTYSQLPALSANQLLGAVTATTPSGLAVPSCSAAGDALTWTSGTGPGCNTNLATSGANSNITSLTGLTTPLSKPQGGTGSNTAAGALSNLAGNPAPGFYGIDCSSTTSCTASSTQPGLIGVQIFTASGTYTPDAGTQLAIAEIVGGGSGGGGCVATSSGQSCVAAQGTSGSYVKIFLSSVASETVTIGAAGTGGAAGDNNGTVGGVSSFGTIASCPGGTTAVGGIATANTSFSLVGAQPPAACTVSGATTLANIPGSTTAFGIAFSETEGGAGGSSPLGTGGQPCFSTAAGFNASGNGAGGGAACSADGAATAGGNGTGGKEIIYEFN